MMKVTNPHNPRKPQHIHAMMTVVISPYILLDQPGYRTVLRKSSVPDAVNGDYVPKGVMSALTFEFTFLLQIPVF